VSRIKKAGSGGPMAVGLTDRVSRVLGSLLFLLLFVLLLLLFLLDQLGRGPLRKGVGELWNSNEAEGDKHPEREKRKWTERTNGHTEEYRLGCKALL
jgi:hypothetical protein